MLVKMTLNLKPITKSLESIHLKCSRRKERVPKRCYTKKRKKRKFANNRSKQLNERGMRFLTL